MNDLTGRICQMELYFDAVQKALENDPKSIKEDTAIREMLSDLIRYYESGQWLEDYEADARSEVPEDLKRGVLSQDGLYNLLCDIK